GAGVKVTGALPIGLAGTVGLVGQPLVGAVVMDDQTVLGVGGVGRGIGVPTQVGTPLEFVGLWHGGTPRGLRRTRERGKTTLQWVSYPLRKVTIWKTDRKSTRLNSSHVSNS